MQLNPDCIRDILLTVEANEDMEYPGKYELLDKYDCQEVIYHLKQCHMEGFFSEMTTYLFDDYTVEGLSPQGHDAVAKIRSEKAWKKVLKKLLEVGVSIKSLIDIIGTLQNL